MKMGRRTLLAVAVLGLLALNVAVGGTMRASSAKVSPDAELTLRAIHTRGLTGDERLKLFTKLPVQLQTRALAGLTPVEESEVWRAHTQSWLVPGLGLTAEQVAILKRAYEFETPETYKRGPGVALQAKQLCQAAERVFPDKKLKAAAMAVIGYTPDRFGRGRGFFAMLHSVSEFFVAPLSAREYRCTCSSGACACDFAPGCQCLSAVCTDVLHNCGCSGAGDCDQICLNCS